MFLQSSNQTGFGSGTLFIGGDFLQITLKSLAKRRPFSFITVNEAPSDLLGADYRPPKPPASLRVSKVLHCGG
jgi:hypothetical protein